MKEDLKDILSNSNKDIDNQQLMDYLANSLSQTETHDLEKQMADDAFMNDAVEGLQQFKKKDLDSYVIQLQDDLRKKLDKKKQRKEKRKLKGQSWIYISTAIILVLVILAYFIITRFKRSEDGNKSHPPVSSTWRSGSGRPGFNDPAV